MQVNIDAVALARLQARGLAIGLARQSPVPDVRSPLAFSLPAVDFFARSFTIEAPPQLRCFADFGPFKSFDQVAPTLFSRPFDRAAVDGDGAICTFDGVGILSDTSGASGIEPGTLMMINDSADETPNLVMGLVETFTYCGGKVSPPAPSLLSAVDWKMSWVLDGLPTCADLFVISKSVPVGTILAPLPTQRKRQTARVVPSFTIGPRLTVDLGDDDLVVTYNGSTSSFSAG